MVIVTSPAGVLLLFVHQAVPVAMVDVPHVLRDRSSAMIVYAMRAAGHREIIVPQGRVAMTNVCHVPPDTWEQIANATSRFPIPIRILIILPKIQNQKPKLRVP